MNIALNYILDMSFEMSWLCNGLGQREVSKSVFCSIGSVEKKDKTH
jgi:hypothetical protein